MTLAYIEDRIVVLLAAELGEPVAIVRRDLIAKGPEWVADSLDLVEVLLLLEEELHFDAPHDIETQQHLRSVKALARYIKALLDSEAAIARKRA